jgi:hypothetical protein
MRNNTLMNLDSSGFTKHNQAQHQQPKHTETPSQPAKA